MQKTSLIAFLFIWVMGMNGQNAAQVVNKNNRPQTVEERQKSKHSNTQEALFERRVKGKTPPKSTVVISPNNYSIDERAYKYYTQKEVAEMSVKEKKEINYLLNNSFEIVKMKDFGCPVLDKSKINVIDYSFYRKENEKSEIIIDQKCNYRLILLSDNDVFKANDLITE